MSTSKSLAKPKIIAVNGSVIRVAHPDISGYRRTNLAGAIAAAGTAMSVYDNHGFADDDWFIIGSPGDSETEEDDVNGTVTRGQSVTVTNTLKFGHELDAPVTRILERKIKIYGAATDGGAGTVIASTTSGINIQWDKHFTEINLITTDTTYAYYYATFFDGTTASAASDYVASSGVLASAVETFINQSLDLSNSFISPDKLTREMLVRWANECQDTITQFMWQEPLSGRLRPKDWSFEIVRDISSITTTQNENEYALSTLTPDPKYTKTDQAIISVQIGDREPLEKLTPKEMDQVLVNQHRTELSVAASAGDTSITVDDTSDFDDSGTIYVGTDTCTYTAKTSTTFTGIPASGTGAVTETQAIDSIVLQGREPGVPTKYCIDDGVIRLNLGVGDEVAGEKIKVRYFKKLDALTEASSVTDVTFYNVFNLFLAFKILTRRGKFEEAQVFKNQFDELVKANAVADQVPTSDTGTYYVFDAVNDLDIDYYNYSND